MNKKYKIQYLELFYKDLEEILTYIKYDLNNKTVATNFFNDIINEISNRAYNAECYEKHFPMKRRKEIYYKVYFKNYTIFYVVKNDIMEIRRVIYNKRDFQY